MRFYISIFVVEFLQKCRTMRIARISNNFWDALRAILAGHSHLLSGVPLAYNTTLLNKVSVIAE